jgi:hypothetical protein
MFEVKVWKREKCKVIHNIEDFEDLVSGGYASPICKDVDFSTTSAEYWDRNDLKGVLFMGES